MALIDCNHFSEALGMSASVSVILPQRTNKQIGLQGKAGAGRHPTLWLLHGLSDDYSTWCRRTSIERYVAELGLAVVMPGCHRSFYQDTTNGLAYFNYLTEELPALCRDFFPLSEAREDNFIAGLSMGGYGALLAALRHPENYAAAASLSGALDVTQMHDRDILNNDEIPAIFGDPSTIAGSQADLIALLERRVEKAVDLPELLAICGSEDFLIDESRAFRDKAEALGVELDYREYPGEHEWGFWDKHIQEVLEWLPIVVSS